MKILYTSDLHGTIRLYRDIIEKARLESVDVVLLGGDLLPRRGQSVESLVMQKRFIEDTIRPFLKELKNKTKTEVGCILGNNDWAATLPLFQKLEEEKLLFMLNGIGTNLNENVHVIGYPYIPPTPFPPKDFEKRDLKSDQAVQTGNYPAISRYDRIEPVDDVEYLNNRSSIEEDLVLLTPPDEYKNRVVIYIMHAPPHDTLLDRLYNSSAMGSKAIKTFIQTEQPSVTLHGHIHESPAVSGAYMQRIGKTISVNPGQPGGLLAAVIFDPYRPEDSMTHTLYPRPKQLFSEGQVFSS